MLVNPISVKMDEVNIPLNHTVNLRQETPTHPHYFKITPAKFN